MGNRDLRINFIDERFGNTIIEKVSIQSGKPPLIEVGECSVSFLLLAKSRSKSADEKINHS